VGIPDSILLKQGRLTPEEFAVMQTHTTIGQSTLNAALEMFPEAQFLKFARDIVACHHERYDGTGYPNGLAGDDIPLCARIIAVADVYDAMRSKRAYKEPCSHAETSQMIIEGSASQFDPRIVDAFLNIEEQFDEVAEAMADQDVEFAY
jgi:putative two-component system response regulator